jgi:uncharacterized protein YgiM (DUF1202 family)
MALSGRNMNRWRITLALFLLIPACKKAEEAASPDDLPDLNKQIRPYVTVENTKVRSGPGPQFRGIADIPANAKIHVVGRDGDWALIVSKKGNAPGFIELAAIKPGEGETEKPEFGEPSLVEGKYEAVADTQVRSGPGLHYPSLADIAKGTKLNVVDEEKGWLKVESKRGNKPGYVEASLAKPLNEK